MKKGGLLILSNGRVHFKISFGLSIKLPNARLSGRYRAGETGSETVLER